MDVPELETLLGMRKNIDTLIASVQKRINMECVATVDQIRKDLWKRDASEFPEFDPEKNAFKICGEWWIFPKYAAYYSGIDQLVLHVHHETERCWCKVYEDGSDEKFGCASNTAQEVCYFAMFMFENYYVTQDWVSTIQSLHPVDNPRRKKE